ncbi:MAG: GntR family transcriptional regulator [Fibrobacteria bacterium]|nr:GntR family transcriptional regulator [Fibrobacteria bacterium]
MGLPRPKNLADDVYAHVKADLFEFRMLPGDRFTESDIGSRTGASRTPVRQALYRLEREGYLEVRYRNGWQVRPLDFRQLDEFYDLRILLEQTAVRRLALLEPGELHRILLPLEERWTGPRPEPEDPTSTADADETFHCSLVAGAGNAEMARVHAEATEKVRIIRRMDFTRQERIEATYAEHAAILRAIGRRRVDEAVRLLDAHISVSRIEVRNLTLHRLQSARSRR